jgi:hypothetical protein
MLSSIETVLFLSLWFHGKTFDIFSQVQAMKTKSDCLAFGVIQASLNF